MKFNGFSALQFRIARPTDQLTEIVAFYEEGIGLPKLTQFSSHAGYDGVIFGLPDSQYQLEFTTHEKGSPCPAPTKDNLLVLYIEEKDEIQTIINPLANQGFFTVEPENPYWEERGTTIEDPDGWRVVLMNTKGI
ncbi:Glyoxalase/Bleomycin resistance protein/Dioxygenase superfamily protein [Halobacillus alkaliphilus]|uniref:Glyoxalase/Bleomycin resistance protein/Dioxygenase superfamily protein n=1 Tax=Halobacillus alkaliphilus TaxID=396056 RepID=A0A1I2K6V0_9BACI|nr:VOC family protein [Halobacillus alkaliphilus]SFF60616.1 Glyoxalase/Bleomycin resistance protein/Dioxygenase superfamily protein [Halobacillus alkaliphilus]